MMRPALSWAEEVSRDRKGRSGEGWKGYVRDGGGGGGGAGAGDRGGSGWRRAGDEGNGWIVQRGRSSDGPNAKEEDRVDVI